MIKLRDYQKQAVNDIQLAFKKGKKRLIVVAPTGSGKTVIFTYISDLVAKKGKKILILTDRVELLMQADGALKKIGVNAFLIQAGIQYLSENFHVYIAMSQTLKNRIDKEYWKKFIDDINLVIIDECHVQEFNYIFESGVLKNQYVLGFTATPKRTGKMRQLGLDYEDIISSVEIKELIEQGYLMNDDYYGISNPDMSAVAIDRMKGDFKESAMFEKFNSPQVYAGAVENYQKIANNTRALIFCVNIEHCVKTCLEFKKAGIKAKFITSSISKPKFPKNATDGQISRYQEHKRIYDLYHKNIFLTGKRSVIFNDFKIGKIQVLINAGIATKGYDNPAIQTVIILRATISLTLWLQMIGRGSRIYEGKTHFNILDFGGNAERLGHYTETRNWQLWHDEKKSTGLAPLKECGYTNTGQIIRSANDKKGCRRLILASHDICPFCGFKYPAKVAKRVELAPTVMSKQFKQIRTMDFNELYEYWKIKGHRTAWLWRQLYMRDGANSIELFGRKFGWSYSSIYKAINYCKKN